MIICGIDPGQSGGVAMIEDNAILYTTAMPVLNKIVVVPELVTMLDTYNPDRVLIELQGIRGGQRGAMAIGANYGRILAAVEYLELPYRVITAPVWNRRAGIPAKLKGKEKKEASFAAAKREWGESFTKLGLRPTQDGPVEALLIARFGE